MTNNTTNRTRSIIILGFRELMNEKTFDQITIKDICENCQIHRSSFYRYYEDKYLLMGDLLRIIAQEINRKALESEENVFEVLIDYMELHKAFFANTLLNNDDLFSELVDIASKLLLEQASVNDNVISQKINLSPEPELLSDFYSSGMVQVLKKWISHRYSYSKEELKEIINSLIEQ